MVHRRTGVDSNQRKIQFGEKESLRGKVKSYVELSLCVTSDVMYIGHTLRVVHKWICCKDVCNVFSAGEYTLTFQ